MFTRTTIARRSAPLLASVCICALAAPATAQDTAESAEDIIVTAQAANQTQVAREGSLGALGDRSAEDVPFQVRSYNAALILNQQPQSLGQVLENDPSVRTTYGFGNAAEQFIIRGFVLAGDDVGYDGLYGISPRQLVAPELYEQVQLLSGASAFLNGAAPGGTGLGGSVNLVPKRADDALLRTTINFTSDAHIGGSLDFARRSANGRFGLRINGAYRSGDVSINDEFRQAAVVGAALDYDGGPLRLSLDVAYQRVRVDQLRPKVTLGTATIPAVPRADQNYAQDWSYTTLRDIFGVARLEYDVADNAQFHASFGARDGSERGIYQGITVNNATTGAATGTALFVPRTDNNEAGEAGLRVNLAAGGVTHEFNIGGSILWQVNRNAFDFLYGPGFAGYQTNIYNTPPAALPASAFVGGNLADPFPVSRTRLWSVFAADTLGFADDRVLITAGLRLQTINTRAFSYFGGAQSSAYDESAVTPVFGIVVKPTEGLSLYANRIQGLSQGPTAPIDATLSNSGEAFAPYRSTQYEVGARLSLNRFNASVALFTTDQPSAYALPDAANPGLNRFDVYGTQRNRGVEVSVDGEPVDGLRLIAGFSVNDATFRDTAGGLNEGNTAPGVPDYLANANVEWDVPFLPAVTLTGRVVHTGPQMVNIANTLELEDWTRFDLGARFVADIGGRALTLRANVDNVANSRYWASAFDIFSPQLLQGAPRTFKLSASVDF